MRYRGFTIVEATLGGVIFALLFASVTVAVVRDTGTQRVIIASLGPEQRARSAFERMVTELRMAAIWGEDFNRNGFLDPGEDVNGNGLLERAWDLPIATPETRNSLAFNVRTEERDAEGEIVISGILSLRRCYRMIGDTLVREMARRRPDGSIESLREVIAEGITDLRFSLDGRLLTAELDVRIEDNRFADPIRTFRATVWLTN